MTHDTMSGHAHEAHTVHKENADSRGKERERVANETHWHTDTSTQLGL